MPKKKIKSAAKPKRLATVQPWYAIMLDYEIDLTPGYWPIRVPSDTLADVEREMWINGNPSSLPVSDGLAAELLKSKSLADKNTRQPFSGGIYRFTKPVENNP